MSPELLAASLDLQWVRHTRQWTGPCPACGYRTGFVLGERDGRLQVRCYAGGCATEVIMEALGRPVERRAPEDDKSRGARVERARAFWRRTHPAAGTPVEDYLRSRGYLGPIPADLRHAPDLSHGPSKTRWPAMVAAARDGAGRVQAVHRTWLRPDGAGKAPVQQVKMSLGPVAGCAVRLSAVGRSLAVAEGIETALSAVEAGFPCWSALSAGNMPQVDLPPEVREVYVVTDSDDGGIGRLRATQAADRWKAEGRVVYRINAPPGMDLNDILRHQEGAR